MLRETKQTLQTDIAGNEGAKRGIQAALSEALPQMRKHYRRQTGDFQAAEQELSEDLAAIGPAASPFAAASAREAAGAKRRLAEAATSAVKELEERKVSAAQGAAYANRQAFQTYKQDTSKIAGQAQDLAREQGEYAGVAYGKLMEAERGRRLERAQMRQEQSQFERTQGLAEREFLTELTGRDPVTGLKPKGGAGADRYERGEVTTHQGLVKDVQNVASTVRSLRKGGDSFAEILEVLKGPTEFKDKSGETRKNPYGGTDAATAQAAIDIVAQGGLKKTTLRSLKAQGFLPPLMPKGWRSSPASRRTQRAGRKAVRLMGY